MTIHASAITATERVWLSTTSPRIPTTAPPATQGQRRPYRLRVRSDSAPASGLPSVEASAPAPVTSPTTYSFASGAISCACSAISTWIGP